MVNATAESVMVHGVNSLLCPVLYRVSVRSEQLSLLIRLTPRHLETETLLMSVPVNIQPVTCKSSAMTPGASLSQV